MASLTLTNDRRDSIIRAALTSTFTARANALKAEGNSIAELAYSHLYPNDIQTKMAALPAEFFSQVSVIYCYLADARDPVCVSLASSRKISAIDKEWRRPAYSPTKGSAVFIRIHKLKLDTDKLVSDRDTFKSELKRFLAGITTVKKLKEVWPEGEEFYKHLTGDAPAKNALAIVPDTINAMIGTMKEVK